MKRYNPEEIRNIALVGHGGTGKTTLASSMLFAAKATTRLDLGLLDFEPEEEERGSTISSIPCWCEWKKCKINIIDTPGDSNFVADAYFSLSAVDIGVFLVSGVDHVEVQTERLWKYAEENNLSKIVYVSMMDRERADFEETLKDIRENLQTNGKFVPLLYPIGKESEFKGVVDVLNKKAYIYSSDGFNFEEKEIPQELKEKIDLLYNEVIDDVAESDDKLLNKYLEEGELSKEEIFSGLQQAISKGKLIPIVTGCALKGIGIPQFLDLLVNSCPSPLTRLPVKAKKGEEEVEIKVDATSPFVGRVFKTLQDQYTGKLSILRVFRGSLNSDSIVVNVNKDVKERVGTLFIKQGKEQQSVSEVGPGDIVTIPKLKDTQTGDTLCGEGEILIFPPLPQFNTVIGYALKPKTKADEDKISTVLSKLLEADPTLRTERDVEAKELILHGMGQVHIKTTVSKLKRFGVNVELAEPKVPYRETLKGKVTGIEGKHKKQTGGRGQFGICYINVEPLPRGQGFEFVDQIVGGAIPRQYIPSVEKGIRERMKKGILAGYPIVDIKVTLYDGKYHEVDSSDYSFQMAGSKALKAAFEDPRAKPVLLEPIWNVEIVCPEEVGGDVMGEVNRRRGRVLGMESRGKNQLIKAQMPFAELLDFSPQLESITGGRGSFTMAFSHYDEVPPQLAQKIIEQAKKREEEEE